MIRRALFPVLALLLVTAFVSTGQSPTRISIMHTNDLHGQVFPRNGQGGLAEIAAIIREASPDLILDAGDLFTGTYIDDLFEGQATIQAMNAIGYAAGTIGNHEFDYGQTVLAARLRDARFPLLSANLETPIPGIQPFTLRTIKGIRFGIIGLTTQELRTSTHPRHLAGVRVLDVVETLERLLPEIRRQADFVIVTAHLTDEEERRVAKAFPDIRLIVGGHNHTVLGPVQVNQTLIAKTGNSGRNVGRVDMEFVGTRLSRIDARLIPVVLRQPDRDVAALLVPFQLAVEQKLGEVLGEATAALTRADDAESSLANLVADAYRMQGKTEIGLVNIGGIRAPIPRGPVTWGEVFEVFPFRDTLVTLKLTGAQLKRILATRLLAVSGIRMRYDPERAAGNRLIAVTLADGTAINDTTLYSVAVNDFMVAGGDGFGELARGTEITDTHFDIRDVLSEYVKARRTLSPVLDGRVAVR